LLDGYTRRTAFVMVALPIVRPGIAAAALLAFIFAWNNYVFPLILADSNAGTVTVAITKFLGGDHRGPAAANTRADHSAVSGSGPFLRGGESLMATVSLANLRKTFGKVTAVDDLSVDIADGEFFVILGPSGAGKTTTLKSVAGLVDIDAGSVHIGGVDMTLVEPYHRNVAMAFE